MKPSGRITLYIKDLSEDEMDFYFNNRKRASTLIKNAMHNYYEAERGNAGSEKKNEEYEKRNPIQRKTKESKSIPSERKESAVPRLPKIEAQAPIAEQPLLKVDIPKADEISSSPPVTVDEQEKIKAMLLKNFKII